MHRLILSRAPGLARSVANDNADILACTSWHTEGNIFGIALLDREGLQPRHRASTKYRKVQFRTFSASCLDSAQNADVGDATPLERDEKLPDVMGLQLLNVQEPSLEQDAVKDASPPGGEPSKPSAPAKSISFESVQCFQRTHCS